MADEVMAYCVKEKSQRPMKDAHEVELKNGKHALQGVCASCGTKMTKFISVKKQPAGANPGGPGGAGNPSAPSTPGGSTPPTHTM